MKRLLTATTIAIALLTGAAHAGDVRNNSIVSGGKSSSAPVTVDLAENPTPFTGTPIPRARPAEAPSRGPMPLASALK